MKRLQRHDNHHDYYVHKSHVPLPDMETTSDKTNLSQQPEPLAQPSTYRTPRLSPSHLKSSLVGNWISNLHSITLCHHARIIIPFDVAEGFSRDFSILVTFKADLKQEVPIFSLLSGSTAKPALALMVNMHGRTHKLFYYNYHVPIQLDKLAKVRVRFLTNRFYVYSIPEELKFLCSGISRWC